MTDPTADWSRLHHGIDPAAVPLLRGWLRGTWWVARPLARLHVPPLAVTVVGAVLAVDALLFARADPWLALVLVLAAAAADALDGAIALLSRRASRSGARADKIADRISDTAFAFVLWRCGAPLPMAVAAAVLVALHEGWRELRGGRLRSRITVAERPTRVICAALACGCAGVSSQSWPPTVCAAVWLTAGMVGLAQLAVTARSGGPSNSAGPAGRRGSSAG